MDAPEGKADSRAGKLQTQAQRLIDAMIALALAEVGKKYGLSVGGKATQGREARRVETDLYSVSITTNAAQAHMKWELNDSAIRARAKEIGRPDGVSRMVSKLFGGSEGGTPANWRFCVMVGEKAFGHSSADSIESIEKQARVSSNIADKLSVPLNPHRPETAVFFVVFEHQQRFAVDEDVAVMLQHEPAPAFDDIMALKNQFDSVAKRVWGKEDEPEPAMPERERISKEIFKTVEEQAMLRARLEELGLKGDELDDALEDARKYMHQALKKFIG
jgi:hypothetical protein